MKKSTKYIIIGVIVLLLLIGIGLYASKANATTPPVPNSNINPPVSQPSGNVLDTLIGIFKNLFGKGDDLTGVAYVQVEPIDENGCDANGYNKIGVKCFGAF